MLISIQENDRRSSPRIDCSIQAEVEGATCEILDLSVGGAFLALPFPPSFPHAFLLNFRVQDQVGPNEAPIERELRLYANVRRSVRLQSNGFGIGVEFAAVAPEDQLVLKRYVLRSVIQDIISLVERQTMELEPGDIKDLGNTFEQLRAMQRENIELSLCQRGGWAILTGRLLGVDRGGLTVQLNLPPKEPLLGGKVHISCTRAHHHHYFSVFLQNQQGGLLHLDVPEHIFSYDLRKSPRTPASPEVYVEIPVPYPPGALLRRSVIDVSSEGMAFKNPKDQGYFLPGTPLRELRLHLGPNVPVTLRTGQVMHVTPVEEAGEVKFLKIGVEFTISDMTVTRGRRPAAPPTQEASFFARMASFVKHLTTTTFSSRSSERAPTTSPVDVVRYTNKKREEIVAILNTTRRDRERLHAPLVIIPPGHGKRKESTYALALSLIENFKRRKRDLVVLRYDGIRTLGESFRDPVARVPGQEGLVWTLTQSMEDMRSTLDYAYDNPHFYPTEVILISPSIQAIPARRLLMEDGGKRVHYWISLMGVPSAQEVVRNGTGGIDYLSNHAKGITHGCRQILGITMDVDHFCADAINHGMAFMNSGLADMERIQVPITWLLGSYDAWIEPASVRELIARGDAREREVVELPVGHIPLNGEEAFICFNEVNRRIWNFLYHESVEPVAPNLEELHRTRQLEWNRTPKQRLVNHRSYWKSYMLGDGQSTANYDVFEFFEEYRSFMKHQLDLLDVRPGQSVADMGTGVGNLPCFLLERPNKAAWNLSSLTVVDFVPELLTKVQGRLERLAARTGQRLPNVTYRQVNLQLSPMRALQRFLNGEFFGYDPLKGLLEGLSDYSVEAWKRLADWRIHGLLRGRPMTDDDRSFLESALPPVERQVLSDFNRLARFVQGRSAPEDFQSGKLAGIKQLNLDAIHLWDSDLLADSLPFANDSFDRIACSLVLSYLDNPAETLSEFVRCLKPGGRIVYSSMMPDVDTSRVYQKALKKLQSNQPLELPAGHTRESLVESIRAHINSGARLLQMAEEMQFNFFSKEEMQRLGERSGLSRIEVFPAFGDRPQATIAVGYKV